MSEEILFLIHKVDVIGKLTQVILILFMQCNFGWNFFFPENQNIVLFNLK